MIRPFLLLAAALLTACTTPGPPSVTLDRGQIAQRAFVDRDSDAVALLFREVERARVRGPEVSVQVGAQRLVLAWTAPLATTPQGLPLAVRIAISGTPVLDAAGTGVDLADTRVEEVSVPGVPLLSFNRAADVDRGQSLGTLPLLRLQPGELERDGEQYRATALSVRGSGLRIELQPK